MVRWIQAAERTSHMTDITKRAARGILCPVLDRTTPLYLLKRNATYSNHTYLLSILTDLCSSWAPFIGPLQSIQYIGVRTYNGTAHYRRRFGPSKIDKFWTLSVQIQSKTTFYENFISNHRHRSSHWKNTLPPTQTTKHVLKPYPLISGRPTDETLNSPLLALPLA